MGKPLNSPLSDKLSKYHELLLKWSKGINLVAPSTLTEAKLRHFDDSTQILPLIPEGTRTIFDIGSGAGFPGMVIAIERPNIKVHLIESDTKKCSFLRAVSRETNIPVIIHNQRIEKVDIPFGVVPDVITARALASLTELLILTEQWWAIHPQLTLIFPKGEKSHEEINEALERYNFEVKRNPSQTNQNAQILVLTQVQKR